MVGFDCIPDRQGLYPGPGFESDACGVGFVADLTGAATHRTVEDALTVLKHMEHRGAFGREVGSGDGAGICVGIPHCFFVTVINENGIELPKSFPRTPSRVPLMNITDSGSESSEDDDEISTTPVLTSGRYAVGNIFFRRNEKQLLNSCTQMIEEEIRHAGQSVLAWRKVPTQRACLGKSSRASMPEVMQVFVGAAPGITQDEFERRLFVIRKRVARQAVVMGEAWDQEQTSRGAETLSPTETQTFSKKILDLPMYICSLSSRTIVYKGMLNCTQLSSFYPDLHRDDFRSHVATIHSRFATNTFVSWSRAHPYRMISHNGEINTIVSNINWMNARERLMDSDLIDNETLLSCLPIIEGKVQSDSQTLDQVLELLVTVGGKSLPEALLMLIPEPWQNNHLLGANEKAFYQYCSSLTESWDGPACIIATNGMQVAAVLDRNGLRPCRFYITHDQRIVCASECGVLPSIPNELIKEKGRLGPGRILFADFREGKIFDNELLKAKIAATNPYASWIKKYTFYIEDIVDSATVEPKQAMQYDVDACSVADDDAMAKWHLETTAFLKAFGYTREHVDMLLSVMAEKKDEPLGSMGNDTALSFLSPVSQTIFNSFKQLFAQVTNPPIDPIRESIVMSLACYVGPEGNLLSTIAKNVQRLFLTNPILSMQEMQAFKQLGYKKFRSFVVDVTFPISDGPQGLEARLKQVMEEANAAVESGIAQFLILSDRNVSATRVAIPSLLAIAATHHGLITAGLRTATAIICEVGEVREVHHFCLMFGFGADAVCPWLSFASILQLYRQGHIHNPKLSPSDLLSNYCYSVSKGVLKVIAKLGISTLHSYKGSQQFEAVGIGADVMALCFKGVESRIGGVGFAKIASQYLYFHDQAFPSRAFPLEVVSDLSHLGEYHWRPGDGNILHINTPNAINELQQAVRNDNRTLFKSFTSSHDDLIRKTCIRGQLEFKTCEPIPLDEVEPVKEIVKRFRSGAMSYGSISKETHTVIAIAMNIISAKSNCGEGGEDSDRYVPLADGSMNPERSSIKQVASARFGVTIQYLNNADELQIKMAQGAKPGEGGELPGWKVTEEIAKTRLSIPGVGLISPPPHHDIYSIEDLAQLIFDLKNSNRHAQVSVKLVAKAGIGVVATGCVKAKADHLVISSHCGGTGASRWTSIKHAGLPMELGLVEAHQTLVLNGLRGRVSLETDGHLRSGRDIIMAACLGAEHFGFGTATLISLGCVMMRACHLGTCPVGVATQDPELRKKFKGQPEHVINFMFMMAEECREIMASLGIRKFDDLIGRVDLLTPSPRAADFDLDLSLLLTPAFSLTNDVQRHESRKLYNQHHEIDNVLDIKLIKSLKMPIQLRLDAYIESFISNTDRCVGGQLSSHVATTCPDGLPRENMMHVKLNGTAGQSFGAFSSFGLLLELEGDANDFVGKSLSGATLVIYPPKNSTFNAEDSVICGAVCFYGATSGKGFLRGRASERFCVRNSGAICVIEGVGDHCCEYMTGGRVVVLGPCGWNFGSGMTGGIAYVYDTSGEFPLRCNQETLDLETLDTDEDAFKDDCLELRSLLQQHRRWTGSGVAKSILDNWNEEIKKFIKIFPKDYKRVLGERAIRVAGAVEVGPLAAVSDAGLSVKEAAKNKARDVWNNKINRSATEIEDIVAPALNRKEKVPSVVEERPEAVEHPVKSHGFLSYKRAATHYRPVDERVKDFKEIYTEKNINVLKTSGARCMDCGIPFCGSTVHGCPLGNRIPEFNQLVYEGQWREALDRLLATNNFPEFTGRVCPAPCEGSCTLGLIDDPVTIKSIEVAIINKGFENGWIVPRPPSTRTGRAVAIIGSGPAGLAAADQLNHCGHAVTVYERADRVGGLMIYGVPNMKADKIDIVQRRVDLMKQEGVVFVTGRAGNVGLSTSQWPDVAPVMECEGPSVKTLALKYDAVILATGATVARDLPIPGRQLKGIHYAMEFLHKNTRELLNGHNVGSDWEQHASKEGYVSARGKRVVVIGGGDTGNDCIGTSIRHGAVSIVNFELLPQPPPKRDEGNNPWPEWPRMYRTDYGHEEVHGMLGKDPRYFNILSKEFVSDSHDQHVTGVQTVQVQWTQDGSGKWSMAEVAGSQRLFECDLVLLAMGFVGPQKEVFSDMLTVDGRGNIKADYGKHVTNVANIFAAGDCRRGQSLVVWAIKEGRLAAREVDRYLMGSTLLP